MLSRVSHRKAVTDSIQSRALYNQHRQTLLCSRNWSRGAVRCATINSVPKRSGTTQKKDSEDVSSISARRQMATAFSLTSDEIPFEQINGSISSMMNSTSGFSLPPTQSSMGYIDLMGIGKNPSSRVLRPGKLGLSGDFSEIIPVFEACVRVGRLERARDILEKLNEKALLTEFDAVRCGNMYLRAAVEHLMKSPTTEIWMQELHRWFQVKTEVENVPYDSESIGYMVKLSLQSGEGRRERLVRRYMDLLNEETFIELIEADVLTEQEIGLVTGIYPKYNFALEFEEVAYENQKPEDIDTSQDIKIAHGPSVLATKQKGHGLSSLRRTLSVLDKLPLEGINISTATEKLKEDVQKRLEEDAVESAIERWREENETLTKMGLNPALMKKSLGSIMWEWQIALVEKLKEELKLVDEAEMSEKKRLIDIDRCMYGPLLRTLSPEQVAAVTIIACMTMMGQLTDRRTPLSSLVIEVGRNIEDESIMHLLLKAQKTDLEVPKVKRRVNPKFYMKLKRSRGAGAAARHMSYYFPKYGTKAWPTAVKAKVGAVLISLLIDVAKVPAKVKHPETNEDLVQMQPAFTHSHQFRKGKKTGIVLMNKVLVKQLLEEPVHSLLAKHLPMLVKPNRWKSFNYGGYIVHPSRVMRIKNGDQEQRNYCQATIAQGQMTKVFQGLDVLGKTSWRINQPVFDVMVEAWNTGKQIANFPPVDPEIEIPPEPIATTDPLERGRWIRQVKIAQNIKIGLHSQRCFQNFQLEIARAFKEYEFYFPHNIDFRGRAYPIPPYFNHIGADHCRGLLVFGTGKELGESGLKWLKIHLSNVFGFDKASLIERENFATSKLEEIYDSALHPLTGKKWWLKAEDPWQCLAVCMEIKNALDSPDPTKFVSHLAVHQDGTCNGLQHYAALGGDLWGAKQVNLEPGDRPADVYSAVADLVRESICKDMEIGSQLAYFLKDKITRKTVKQTVMTNVYGVTFMGASAQVRKQLASTCPDLSEDMCATRQNAASYVAKKIFAALSTMFRGAHDIQYWLADCASKITTSLSQVQIDILESEWDKIIQSQHLKKAKNIPGNTKKKGLPDIDEMTLFKTGVIWTSPLGMPVVQPYRNGKVKAIRTSMQNINLSEPTKHSPISKRKQLQGFPPNFIHSLDASHMILSAIGCDEKGLTFAAVHDSFWTHACDVDTMNGVLRDSFVKIHNEDIIGRLAAEFKARYQDSMYLARIKAGTTVYKKVMAWRAKQRSHSKVKPSFRDAKVLRLIEELLLETKRIKLLASKNPKEVKQGKDMETPGSIYETWAQENEGVVDEEIKDLFVSADNSDKKNSDQVDAEENEDLNYDNKINEQGESFSSTDNNDMGSEDSDDLETSDDAESEKLSKFEKGLNKTNAPRSTQVEHLWLHMQFKDIPKKGEFDVSRLKQSKYFFS